MTNQFTWIPVYNKIARKLFDWTDRQEELIAFLDGLRQQGLKVTPLMDQDVDGNRFLLKEIDPFTFFGAFNRGIRDDERRRIINAVLRLLDIQTVPPSDFDGVPVLNSQKSWFISYEPGRKANDVERLWRVFGLALGEDPLNNEAFLAAFDDALDVKSTNINLTMGLFWIRPDTFLNLDRTNRLYLHIELPSGGLSGQYYREQVKTVLAQEKSLPDVSYKAWTALKSAPPLHLVNTPISPQINYWMGGAFWSDREPSDQSERFLDEGIWENGYEDKYLDIVRAMQTGDKIAIKSVSTQRNGLPFQAQGKTVSRMTIKATGTIVANRGDGRTVEVEWDPPIEKVWYFYTYRQTIWQLRTDEETAQRLIRFVFGAEPQDYDWFCKRWWGDSPNIPALPPEIQGVVSSIPYSVDDMIAEGVFLTAPEISQALQRLDIKKNLILQGPPGVGKTFIARKLAYALMEEKDDIRIEMVQFHQSYSYEDFVRGYRPLPDKAGTFGIQDGIFFEFCTRAKNDPDRSYVFIIDEINRGNLSQIFGELLMLIEGDKRGRDHVLPLVYRRPDEPRFYVPWNLYLIGLMNVADRSLAMVDYALRRRFAFMTLKPQFKNDPFRNWLTDRGMAITLVDLIDNRIGALNEEISQDSLLGVNYQIGHSFFCPKGNDFQGLDRSWYEAIVNTEIIPLLREYWFDNQKRAEQIAQKLLAP